LNGWTELETKAAPLKANELWTALERTSGPCCSKPEPVAGSLFQGKLPMQFEGARWPIHRRSFSADGALLLAAECAAAIFAEEAVAGDRILFVDDEIAVLRGYQRVLHGEFAVSTAVGGEEGLAELEANGPYAIVVSDMRMPGMSGAEFLAHAREKAPQTVRMLLTGYADVKAAAEAVNRGNIFRFLTKPCEKADLVDAIREGLKVYHAAVAEKEIVRRAEMIGRSKTEWDASDIHQSRDFEGPTGLPGPARARRHLEGIFGVDTQCYVVLLKLTLLRTIEERYGEEAAIDYLMGAGQFVMHTLRPDDLLFHWSHDVLMAVVRRQMPAAALRKEFERQLMEPRQHLLDVDGKKIMVSISATFDLLPVARFSSFDQMFEAFDAKLIAKM